MNRKRMEGVYVVEFAIIGLLLFVLLFGVLEMGRLLFTVNALDEVVRRGARLATVCTIDNPDILKRAIFNEISDGDSSSLIHALETADLTLIYLDGDGVLVPNPSSSGFSSVRFVQLSVVDFPFTLLIPGLGGAMTLPTFRAILPRESLGFDGESEVPTSC